MKTVEKQQINLKDVQGAFCSWKDCPRITDGSVYRMAGG